MSAFSALPRLYQIVSSKVLYLAHKLQKVPKAKLADSVIVYSKWLGVCICLQNWKREKEEMAKGEKGKLIRRWGKLNPAWV